MSATTTEQKYFTKTKNSVAEFCDHFNITFEGGDRFDPNKHTLADLFSNKFYEGNFARGSFRQMLHFFILKKTAKYFRKTAYSLTVTVPNGLPNGFSQINFESDDLINPGILMLKNGIWFLSLGTTVTELYTVDEIFSRKANQVIVGEILNARNTKNKQTN